MRERRWGPRLGLGRGRVDPEQARFRTAQDVLQYFSDVHTWTHEQLAVRCGISRSPLTRWLNGSREPSLSKLAEVIEPLGWRPMIVLERTEEALRKLVTEPLTTDLLDYEVRAILRTVAAGVEAGLDVLVGGEVAAVLQGISVPTRHLVLHVGPDDLEPFLRMASKQWLSVRRHAGGAVISEGPVSAEVTVAPVRPASRIVTSVEWGRIPVVDVDELVTGSHGVGSSVRRVHAQRSKADGAPRV